MVANLTQRFVFSSLPPKVMKKSSMVSRSLLDEMYMRNTPQNHGKLLGMAIWGLIPLYHILDNSQLFSVVFVPMFCISCKIRTDDN